MYQGLNKYKVNVLTSQNRKVTRYLRGTGIDDIKRQLKGMSLNHYGLIEYMCNNDQIHHERTHRRMKGKNVRKMITFRFRYWN